jgi:hypothetical protein
VLCIAEGASAQIVYNSITAAEPDVQPVQNVVDEIGDDVTLAPGTPRTISGFSLRIFNNSQNAYTGTFTARFYTYSGGLPTTLLWEDDITITDGEPMAGRVLTWNVPNVIVPDQFAWSYSHDVSFPVTETDVLGLAINGVQAVGSSSDELGYYRDIDGFWPTPFRYRDVIDPETGQPFDLDTSWEARIVAGALPPSPEWNVNGSGSWAAAANWTGNVVPNAPGAVASLLGRVTTPGGATITLDGDKTIGRLVIANVNPYVITAGTLGSNLILSGGELGFAEVQVNSGSHTVAARLVPAGDTVFTVAPGASLSLNQALTVPAGRLLRKSGGGTLSVAGGPLTVEDGANLLVNAGRLNSQQGIFSPLGFVDIAASATIAISPGNTPDRTSTLLALTIAGEPATPAGTFDLADNAMIIKVSSDEELRDWIRSARAGGAWTGKGLTSSAAAADPLDITTIGYALNNNGLEVIGPLYEIFGGMPAELNDHLVRFTYNGDANLDGRVDITDYFHIDLGRAARESGWINGDFDHSGGVPDAADYMLIDRAFLSQGAPLSVGAGAPLPAMTPAVVPEPAAAIALVCCAAVLRRRR